MMTKENKRENKMAAISAVGAIDATAYQETVRWEVQGMRYDEPVRLSSNTKGTRRHT
jgi:hypothetical protein